jgi:methionyl-tRNA formyltransferase
MNKIIFCGFGELGKRCLEELIKEKFNVKFIYTHKDNLNNSVDGFAIENNIPYSYIDFRKDLNGNVNLIKSLEVDFLISINFRYIIPKTIFSIPNYALNIHGSLLPKYRGRCPHVWSIINGEKNAGVTSHIIDKGVDTGDIISQKKIGISLEDTGYSLLKKYEEIYPKILMASIKSLLSGNAPKKQNQEEATYFGRRIPEMGYIDFYKDSESIINFVRAQADPYPGAYYYLCDGKKIVINKVEIVKLLIDVKNIGIIKKINNEYYVKCKDAILKIVKYKIKKEIMNEN